MKYALTKFPTPLFNTPDLFFCFGGRDGKTLALDDKGLLRSVETILFPKSKIKLIEQVNHSPVWKIETTEYPYAGPFYTDERFLSFEKMPVADRTPQLPDVETLLKALAEMPPCLYIWGGNWPMGIELLPQLYPNRAALHDPQTLDIWKLKGVDCTGLPYYLTDGYIPRNSSILVNYGAPVLIEGKSCEEIIAHVKPLDFIVWKGHLVWVVDHNKSIESLYPVGLIRHPLFKRLSEIMQGRKPVDRYPEDPEMQKNSFVIRRWHPEILKSLQGF